MIDPRSVVPESIMPGYPFLADTPLRTNDIAAHLKANRGVGVPYTDDMIANARRDLLLQVDPEADGIEAFEARYPKAIVRDFDANPALLSEMDALVAYLQMLGTLADLQSFDVKKNPR
jgi:cytochrome c oxidase cbb3-type subunit 2